MTAASTFGAVVGLFAVVLCWIDWRFRLAEADGPPRRFAHVNWRRGCLALTPIVLLFQLCVVVPLSLVRIIAPADPLADLFDWISQGE